MPRLNGPRPPEESTGKLTFNKVSGDCVDVLYTPPQQDIRFFQSFSRVSPVYPVRLIRIDRRYEKLITFPITTRPIEGRFLKPKYSQIRRITVAGSKYVGLDILRYESITEDLVMEFLERLPSCFIKDYDHGLGLTSTYRLLVETVEELSECAEILISGRERTSVDEKGSTFYISSKDFEDMRKSINRINENARSAASALNEGNLHNFLAPTMGKEKVPIQLGRSPIRQRITHFIAEGEDLLSDGEQVALLSLMTKTAGSIAKDNPDKLATLKDNIELVTLDNLIDRFEVMMTKSLSEEKWQLFLEQNPFILSLALGYPTLIVRGQAVGGGHKLSGSGGKISDFLVKNSLSNNCSIIEIKKPSTDLLLKKAYRSGLFAPSKDLAGAINQVLDQKFHFEKEIAMIKEKNDIYDIRTYSVHCCVIVGKMPHTEELVKSFELFRGNSKNVEILTFDELLESMRNLSTFLKSRGSMENTPTLAVERRY